MSAVQHSIGAARRNDSDLAGLAIVDLDSGKVIETPGTSRDFRFVRAVDGELEGPYGENENRKSPCVYTAKGKRKLSDSRKFSYSLGIRKRIEGAKNSDTILEHCSKCSPRWPRRVADSTGNLRRKRVRKIILLV